MTDTIIDFLTSSPGMGAQRVATALGVGAAAARAALEGLYMRGLVVKVARQDGTDGFLAVGAAG